jgi:hypothetical protein
MASYKTDLTEAELEMANRFWGFGRWDAPFWFIGPEPGGNPDQVRLEQWNKSFNKAELCDCREFHLKIGEMRWHFKMPKPELQKTWRRLILFLKAVKGEQRDRESLRMYQAKEFGAVNGETCVVELSGLSAKGFSSSKFSDQNLLISRIEALKSRLNTAARKPKVVLMYSIERKAYWDIFTSGCRLEVFNAKKPESTVYAFAPSPTSPHAGTDQDWIDLGKRVASLL